MKEDEVGKGCSMHWRDDICLQNFAETLKGKDHSEGLDVDGKIIVDWMLGKYGEKLWIRFIWLRIGISGRTL
jgi:hypothetical protein